MKKELYDTLDSIEVTNWYCGKISAFYAWSNNCTIASKSEQNKVRRALKKIGYACSIGGGIISQIRKIK